MKPERSDALVFFGATGDLAYKQIFPALSEMVRHGRLDVPIVGIAKSGWNLDQLKGRARESIQKHGDFDQGAYDKLCARLDYIDGDYGDKEIFVELGEILKDVKRPLNYLAIPPSLFATVVEGLASAGCAENGRVVVEKPFARDLASAQKLNATLHRFFPEHAIFRIDHFLGKEPVQNLIYFRFANPLVEAGWSSRDIESVQITMAEEFGVSGRGKLYEELGAVRDVIQNHMLMIIACTAMESPAGNDHDSLRNERARLLKTVRPLDPAEVVRGQYRGYRKEPDVASDSQVETYAAAKFYIDNDRWYGVPFYLRTGKCLPVTVTEVLVRFKRLPRPVLDEAGPTASDYYRFRLSPDVVLALGTKVKRAGERMVGERVELVAHHQPPDEMQPYERLLSDAANGDPALFVREDGVEASWRVVDPVLGNVTPLYEYEQGSWGPREVEDVLIPEGGWHAPKPSEG